MTSEHKILFLAANPKDTLKLRLDEEVREIEAGLMRSPLKLTQRWAVRPRDLQQALFAEAPEIVHFSGHAVAGKGTHRDERGRDRPQKPEIFLQLI